MMRIILYYTEVVAVVTLGGVAVGTSEGTLTPAPLVGLLEEVEVTVETVAVVTAEEIVVVVLLRFFFS